MSAKIFAGLEGLVGKPACRQRVGRGRSLSIGFGERVPHQKKSLPDSFYGEWELGTYTAAWRILQFGAVICGSADVVDSIEELDRKLQGIKIGAILTMDLLSSHDVRFCLDNAMTIDFMCASSEEDETVHLFGPNNLYLEFIAPDNWKLGASNLPWPQMQAETTETRQEES